MDLERGDFLATRPFCTFKTIMTKGRGGKRSKLKGKNQWDLCLLKVNFGESARVEYRNIQHGKKGSIFQYDNMTKNQMAYSI